MNIKCFESKAMNFAVKDIEKINSNKLAKELCKREKYYSLQFININRSGLFNLYPALIENSKLSNNYQKEVDIYNMSVRMDKSIDFNNLEKMDRDLIERLIKASNDDNLEDLPILLENIDWSLELEGNVLIYGKIKICIITETLVALLVNTNINKLLYPQSFIFKQLRERFNFLIYGSKTSNKTLCQILYSLGHHYISDVTFNIIKRGNISRCGYCGDKLDKKRRCCSGCRILFYCNRKCQKRDWKLHHRSLCKEDQLAYDMEKTLYS